MAVHPFGLVAWSEDDRRGCTFVTSLHGSAVEEVLAGMDGDDAVRARVRSDERLGTAVVELSSTTVGVDHLVGLSRDVVVQCTVEELTRPQALVRW
jgi:hypothetical protein